MEELDGIINSNCISQSKINKMYNGNMIVETNDHFEKAKKNKKRHQTSEEEDSIEEEKEVAQGYDAKEQFINEYNEMDIHQDLNRLKALEKKLEKEDLTDEEEYEYNQLQKKISKKQIKMVALEGNMNKEAMNLKIKKLSEVMNPKKIHSKFI
mmetsp:Transcript_27733/g.26783  ORF Transcript_27733/g.26783 Transcript_27733/m.26783 type:complete len:153 (+) Transcript_27733:91-549(+)